MTVRVIRDGSGIIAMAGDDPQTDPMGSGASLPNALRDLADCIERENWHHPDLEVRRPATREASPLKPIRVK